MAYENLDFLNLNSLRNYPLKEGITRQDSTGSFVIPNDFIVDLQLAASNDPTDVFHISRISNLEDDIAIEISDQDSVLVGTFTLDASSHTKYKVYDLTPTEEYERANGTITIGTLSSLQEGPSGTYYFTQATAVLEMRTMIPALKGLSRLVFINASGETFALSGDVEIEARTNLQFKNGTGNRVILDAGNGLGLNTDCGLSANCIKTINGVPPDENGNFTLDFSDCALLSPIPANTGLLLEDSCCKPCVGCNDIEELTGRLMQAENLLIQLRDYYTSLELLYQQFKTTSTYTCDCPPSV